jgi:hypothetical protein
VVSSQPRPSRPATRAWLGLWAVLAASALIPLQGQDEVAADAIWAAALEEAGMDRTARIWVDAARVNTAVAPWQPAWARARARVGEVAQTRRAALPDDRGGVRRRVELPR